MTDRRTLHRSSPGHGLSGEIEELVVSLPGVRSVRAEVEADERLRTLEVALSEDVSRHRVSRAIQSLLLIYLDLAIDDDQIAVSLADRPAPRPDPRPPSEEPDLRHREAQETDHGSAGVASAHSGRLLPSASSPAACRLVRYAVQGDAAPGVEVAVTVERDAERFDARVRTEGFASLTPEIFARAAAAAAARAVGREDGTGGDGAGPGFGVGEVEQLRVFGRPHLAVAVSPRSAGDDAAAIGFAAVERDFPRAAVLAVLDAVRRLLAGASTSGGDRSDRLSSFQPPDPLR